MALKTPNDAEKQEIADTILVPYKAYLEFAEKYIELIKSKGLNSEIKYEEIRALEDEYKNKCKAAEEKLGKLAEIYENINIYKEPAYKKTYEEIKARIEGTSDEMKMSSIVLTGNADKFGNKSAQENIKLNERTTGHDELVQDLLSKNKGLAIGDAHTQVESLQLMNRNMAAAKKQGLDTIYLEMPAEMYEVYSKLSDKQLKEVIDKGRVRLENGETYDLLSKHEIAEQYGAKNAEPYFQELAETFRRAKKEGVRIVNMDARESENPLGDKYDKARIGKTNLEWPAAIEQDRAQNQMSGKYFVFGGLAHFTNGGVDGVVDEQLGIPSIAYTKSAKETGAFRKADKDDGIDYWLDGGKDYERMQADLPQYRQSTKDFIKDMGYDPKTLKDMNGQVQAR